MKRNMDIVATVMLGCVAAGSILAQETKQEPKAVPPYQVYGLLHVSLDRNGDDAGLYLSSNASRLGLKGTMDVQPGWKAVWQVETLVNLDESGSTWATRDSYAGLQSENFGKVILGRFDTPCKTLSRKTDFFGDQVGNTRNILSVGSAGFDLRTDNTVMFVSPMRGGANASVAYRAPEGVEKAEIVSGNIMWTSKDFLLAVAAEQHGEMVSGADTNRDGVVDLASAEKEQGIRAGAKWKTGALTLAGLYELLLNDGGIDGQDRATFGGGAAWAWRQTTFKAQYYLSDATDGKPDTGADLLAVGVDYAMGGNTVLYLAYAAVNNEAQARVSATGGGHGEKVVPAAGEDSSAVSLGVIYSF